jgi:hypothetical protein
METYTPGAQVHAGSLATPIQAVFLQMKMVIHISQFQDASLL